MLLYIFCSLKGRTLFVVDSKQKKQIIIYTGEEFEG